MNGASSLGAFVFLANRPYTRIYTVDRLHAKAYICGDKALVGSANFTDRGLGLSQKANVEILRDS
jgi:phosphatidylserine/phosphatidylglycerophosphate/cardiolipin synthase-like enzyme